MLIACAVRGSGGNFVHGSLLDMPWTDNTFDLIYSHEVLEHIPTAQIPACLAEMVRVSRGRLLLTISLRLAGKDDPRGTNPVSPLGSFDFHKYGSSQRRGHSALSSAFFGRTWVTPRAGICNSAKKRLLPPLAFVADTGSCEQLGSPTPACHC